jgi:hypothetical protein
MKTKPPQFRPAFTMIELLVCTTPPGFGGSGYPQVAPP